MIFANVIAPSHAVADSVADVVGQMTKLDIGNEATLRPLITQIRDVNLPAIALGRRPCSVKVPGDQRTGLRRPGRLKRGNVLA